MAMNQTDQNRVRPSSNRFVEPASKRPKTEEGGGEDKPKVFVPTGKSLKQMKKFKKWYNTPSQGQCGPGESPGDSSGCTWRLAEVAKAINETCMRRHYGEYFATLSKSKACFDACPKPWEVRGDCFLDSFLSERLPNVWSIHLED